MRPAHLRKTACQSAWLLCVCLLFTPVAHAKPYLRCEVTYAGLTHEIVAHPVANPYLVKPVDIAERFSFKVVMASRKKKLEHVLIYTYLNQDTRPLLVQQVKYTRPFQTLPNPYLLTGEQHVYAGPIERELIYRCWLGGSQP